MLSSLFDEYSLNARVRPALLALLPLVLSIYATFPTLYSLVAGLFGLVVASGFITALAHLSRSRGKAVEAELFNSWGGKPTTILLRQSNETLDVETKRRYHQFLASKIDGWILPSKEQESSDLKGADVFYEAAVKWLLEKTRDTKAFNLIFKENISYGFRRNCLGLKWFGFALSILSTFFVAFMIFNSDKGFGFEQNTLQYSSLLFSLIMFIWWTAIVNEAWVKDAAESYALRLLASCDQL